ncbi:MAG: APC family permease [Proteobacteria bacterium]|nr:APC family permease [Pseudomonadota bacterium]MBU1713951.1 APC family permease [Pseudomonadota bacterium]
MTELRRAVGLRTVVSTGAGMALATVTYLSFIELASYLTGNSSWIAILTAGIMAVLAGSCFAELNSMFPTAAGIKLFIEKAFGEKAAIIISGVYVLGQLSIIGAEIYILSQGISQGFPQINPLLFAVVFGIILFYLNLRGIKIAGTTQDIIAYSMFFGLIAVSVYGFYRIDFHIINPFEIGSLDGFIQAVAIGMSGFIAFEWVITMSEEVTDVKIIPKGMMLALGLLTVTYALFSMAMTSVLSKEELAWVLKPEGLPIPHILYGKRLLGGFGLYLMIVMALLASLTSINAGLMTSSRFLYAMARDWSLPKFMARLHSDYATPWVAMVVVMLYCVAVTAFGFITHYILCMILIIAAVECMIYIVIALCVIRLRYTEPDRKRDFKIKGGIFFPVIVIIVYGIVGGFILFGPVKPQDVLDQRIALFFILGLLVLAIVYVFAVLPGMREKYRKIAEARTPRRRRKG